MGTWRTLTLGPLVQASNSFGRVFASLSIVSENWGGINEWRSTLVRLREFERELYMDGARKGGRHRSSGSPDSGSETELLSAERPLVARTVVLERVRRDLV